MARILAIAAVMAGLTFVVTPARACDSNYPWLCPPVPSIDPPETAAPEPATPAKPLPIAKNHPAKTKAVKAERTTAMSRKSAARKAAMHRWAARARAAKLAAARRAAEAAAAKAEQAESRKVAADAESRKAAADVASPARRPVVTPPPAPRMLDGMGQGNTGFATLWAEHTTDAAEPVSAEPAPAATGTAAAETAVLTAAPATAETRADPVSTNGVALAAQNEVNALDLAAAQPAAAADSSWVRKLFLAFGGLIAVGSALRLFI